MQVVITICSVIGTLISVLVAYKAIYVIVGIFKTKKFKPAKENHKYGIIIPCRNEEKVIKNILESFYNQDYPKDCFTIFVAADKCTDQTIPVAQSFKDMHPELNIEILHHTNPYEKTKGFVLKYAFEQIKEKYGSTDVFEGYFIFDADNYLMPDYLTRMNEAFDEGNKIIVSFRNSKNFNQNWISFQYGVHWISTCLYESRGRSVLNGACRVQGTGFLFHNELVKDGWTYTSLTEDRSFCTDAVIQGYKITYCEAAQFYDEQPHSLKVAFRQRIRWSKGHLQSTVENCPKLIKNIFKFNKNFVISYDSFWVNFPYQIESIVRKIISYSMKIAIAIVTYVSTPGAVLIKLLWAILASALFSILKNWISTMIEATFAIIYYRKRLGKLNFFKTFFGILMYPLFHYIGKWTAYIALFKKVEWKPIPHDSVLEAPPELGDKNPEDKKDEPTTTAENIEQAQIQS